MIKNVNVNYKLEPFATRHKPIKIAIGGRGSGKSLGFGDIFTTKMLHEGADIYCLREYQESIADSVHRVFKGSINDRLKLDGWDIQVNTVIAPNGAKTKYKGASRNPDSIQSAQDYKYSWFEEAHTASQESLDKLLPTILRTEHAECWFSANPQSSEDPFSKRFINPYLDELLANGIYEDELHLIVMLNWRDNPWWNEAQETLRKWDFDNRPRATYDWIWEGAFNDSVENGLVQRDWFDSCVDAHIKLGFEPTGAKMSTHDPSDEGSDSKGFVFRHGSVVEDVQEKIDGDVNEGCDWATGLAITHGSDIYSWDCDGMGIALKQQTATALDGKQMIVSMFKGSEGVDFPDAIYSPVLKTSIQDQRTNKQVFKNKRAQYYFELRDRILRTHRAVTLGIYSDPEKMISFRGDMPLLNKLRSEICRLPIKPNPNGMFELYTKEAMKSKFKVASPNLADSAMMSMRMPHVVDRTQVKMPKPIRPMGRR